MATEITSLSVRINAELSGFRRGKAEVQRGVKDMEASFDRLQRSVASMERTFGILRRTLATVGFGALIASTVQAAARLDALEMGLRAITGGSRSALVQMAGLADAARQVAGLGFEEAVQASVRLQSVGFSAESAERAVRAFGNAVAMTGGGKWELERIVFQLTQMAAAGKVITHDLRPVLQTAPAVSKAVTQLFGTTSAEAINEQVNDAREFLELLVAQLEKLPPVAGGVRKALDDMSTALFRIRAGFGRRLFATVEDEFKGLTDAIFDLAGSESRLTRAFGLVRDSAIAAAAIIGGRLVGSLTTAAAASVRKTAASIAEARAQVAATRANLETAIANLQMARSMGASTAAMMQQRAAALQVQAAVRAHNAALAQASITARAAATGMGILRGAFALLGGWPGIIIAGLTGLWFWLNRTKRAAEEAAAAIEDAIAQRAMRASTFDEGQTLEEISRTAARIGELEQRLASLRAELASAGETPLQFGRSGLLAPVSQEEQRRREEIRSEIEETVRQLEIERGAAQALVEQYTQLAGARLAAEKDAERTSEQILADVHNRLTEALRQAAAMERLLGDGFDETAAKTKAYEVALRSLIEAGIDPAHERVREYARALLALAADTRAEERALRIREAHEDLAETLRVVAQVEQVLGESYDANAARVSAYRSAIEDLIMAGLDPADTKLREYAESLRDVEAQIKANEEAERRRTQAISTAMGIVERTMTPQEQYRAQIEALGTALDSGAISQRQYNRAVALLDKELARATRSLRDTLAEQGVAAGEALIRGLLTGARNMKDILKSALINLAISYVMGPVKLALGIASPSKVFRSYGEALGDGLVIGITSRIGAVQAAAWQLAGAARLPALSAAGVGAFDVASIASVSRAPVTVNIPAPPAAADPVSAARDAAWLRLMGETMRELEHAGAIRLGTTG